MKTKKKLAAAIRTGEFELVGPRVDGDTTYLSRPDLLLVEMMQAKTLAALQAIALARQAIETLERTHVERMQSAKVELAAATGLAKQLEERCAKMWAEMAEAYGLDFTSVAYDDATGKITTIKE